MLVPLLLLPIFSIGQDSSEFNFTLIDSAEISKPELFVFAKTWMANTFVSSKSVIEMEDKDAGIIIGNGVFTKRLNGAFGNQLGLDVIFFTITINVKENKYRCILSNFTHKYIQQTSAHISGQTFATSMSNAFSSNRNGGALNNEKPACSSLSMTKKQWSQIKDYTKEQSALTLESLKKSMREGKTKADF